MVHLRGLAAVPYLRGQPGLCIAASPGTLCCRDLRSLFVDCLSNLAKALQGQGPTSASYERHAFPEPDLLHAFGGGCVWLGAFWSPRKDGQFCCSWHLGRGLPIA